MNAVVFLWQGNDERRRIKANSVTNCVAPVGHCSDKLYCNN